MSERPQEELAVYALELGVSKKTVRIVGGMEKLKRLTPEARKLLLFPTKVAPQKSLSRFRWPDM